MTRKVCIYHGNCCDGFTAAWVVRKALGNDVEFYAGIYQATPPDVSNADVYIVDFSYKRDVMENIIKDAKSVTHIDHHVSAILDLEGLEDKMTTFYSLKNEYSGALLTWMYFFPNEEVPKLIRHVDDRDRWQFKIPGTREIQAAVFSYEYTFDNWDTLMVSDLSLLEKDGQSINRKHLKDVNELINVLSYRLDIAGYNVPVCNVPYTLSSEVGNIMARGEPFAVCYFDKPEGREFSLRSSEDGLDVSIIAASFGGGGHKHASGFRLSHAESDKLFSQRNN